MAVLHQIKKGQEIWPLGKDSPILYSKPGYCAVMLRFKMMNEKNKWRTHPGKYISLMGGSGQAGGFYENITKSPEGWSHYLNSPVVSGTKGTIGAKNGLRGVLGVANRSALGAVFLLLLTVKVEILSVEINSDALKSCTEERPLSKLIVG